MSNQTKPKRQKYKLGHIMNPKVDSRPRIGGWCEGNYIVKCRECNLQFIGDKRAWNCADCAYAKLPDVLTLITERDEANAQIAILRDAMRQVILTMPNLTVYKIVMGAMNQIEKSKADSEAKRRSN